MHHRFSNKKLFAKTILLFTYFLIFTLTKPVYATESITLDLMPKPSRKLDINMESDGSMLIDLQGNKAIIRQKINPNVSFPQFIRVLSKQHLKSINDDIDKDGNFKSATQFIDMQSAMTDPTGHKITEKTEQQI